MHVGITYDLRDEYLEMGFGEEETAEFDRADTIDAIENALAGLGYRTERIGHVKKLVNCLSEGKSWDIVFNIAEGYYGIGREAQVPAILDAFQIPYTFSDPLVLSLTLNKAITKRVVRDLGIPTPDFAIVEKLSDIDSVSLPFPLFAKPVAEGTGKGISDASEVGDRKNLRALCRDLIDRFKQPVLLETYLPGREFTVGIIGTGDDAKVVGVIEVLLNKQAEKGAYSYINKKKYEELVTYRLVDDKMARDAARVALDSWVGLGCRDAGRIDIRSDADGKPNFIEVNPLAGLHPVHSDLPILCRLSGISFEKLIDEIMKSALKRVACSRPR
ncbi:MAG: D-alanine--D-alanine ligase [Pseudomonadota bacterium]|nr:ATP-grasp domain-containing protein [Pseudomonadota bacterium]MBU1569711.1 ATP-grasp domain-containing protein [Pseudomonadota bacterium]